MSAESVTLKDSNYYSWKFTNFHDLSLRQSIQDYDTWSTSGSSEETGHCKDVVCCRKATVCLDDETTGVHSTKKRCESVCSRETEEVRRPPLSTRCYSSNALTLVSKSFGQTGICMSTLKKKKKSEEWNPAEAKKLAVQGRKGVVGENNAVSSILLKRAPSIVFEDIGGVPNSSWSDGLAIASESTLKSRQPDSTMSSMECWDYSMELECLNGQDGE